MPQKIDSKNRYACFFAGIGGSCLGAKRAGLECALALDNNDLSKMQLTKTAGWLKGKEGIDWEWRERLPAIQTREKNFKDGKGLVMDIRKYKFQQEHDARFVLGSPPCKRFSTAAETRDEDDEDQIELDEALKELGTIFFKKAMSFRSVEYIIMENVVGLFNDSNRSYLIGMKDVLEKAGWSTEMQIYNAVDFGICQTRRRLFLIASKSGRKGLLPYAPKENGANLPRKTFMEIMETGADAESRKRLAEAAWGQSTYLTAAAKEARRKGQMKIIIPNRAEALKLGWEKQALDEDKYPDIDMLPTIACNAGGGPTRKKWTILPFTGSGYRNATLLEGLRAQDMPDEWLDNLPGNKSQAWDLIGNAVASGVMRHLLLHLREVDKFHDGLSNSPPPSCQRLAETYVIETKPKKAINWAGEPSDEP